ncbi:arginine transporter, partial [Shigella dysenteriae]
MLREGISFNYKLNECDFCFSLSIPGNDSNLLIVFYVQIMPD